ncbi:hypothetical protein B0H11DRAFT_1910204 [Mycena galericulata]|nr:hypothetical protein B0H11DRAFT_1910204 [Mycena galericulata]
MAYHTTKFHPPSMPPSMPCTSYWAYRLPADIIGPGHQPDHRGLILVDRCLTVAWPEHTEDERVISILLPENRRLDFDERTCYQYLPSLGDDILREIHRDGEAASSLSKAREEYKKMGIIVPHNVDPMHHISSFIVPPISATEALDAVRAYSMESNTDVSTQPSDSRRTLHARPCERYCIAFLRSDGVYTIRCFLSTGPSKTITRNTPLISPSTWRNAATVIENEGEYSKGKTRLKCRLTCGDLIEVDVDSRVVEVPHKTPRTSTRKHTFSVPNRV